MRRLLTMPMRSMGMMGRLFMLIGVMVLRGLFMMVSSLFMMLRSFFMMFRRLL